MPSSQCGFDFVGGPAQTTPGRETTMHRRRRLTRANSESLLRLRSIGPAADLCAMAAMGSLVLATTSAAASVSTQASTATGSSALSTDQQEATASYQALQQNLYEAPALLYQGLPSNPCDPYSCL